MPTRKPFFGLKDLVVQDDQDVDIIVVGDSTGESYTEWAGLFAQAVAAAHPSHTVEWEAYANGGAEDWGDTRTVSTGTGSNTIKFWIVASGSWGMSEASTVGAYDHPDRADHILTYIGINHSATLSTNVTEWETGLGVFQGEYPDAYITVVAQHPVITPGYAAPGAWAASAQNAGAREIGETWDVCFYDFETALLNRDTSGSIDLDDFFDDGDGVHPNATGSQYIADQMLSLYNAGYLGVAVTLLDRAELLLRANTYAGSGNWLDESGNGHNASISGAKFLKKGTYTQSVWLPGIVGNNLAVTSGDWDWTSSPGADPDLADDLSFAVRVRMDDYDVAGSTRIYGHQDLDYEAYITSGLVGSRFVLRGVGSSEKVSSVKVSLQDGVTDGEPLWVKLVYDISEHEHLFYYSLDDTDDYDQVSWTQLGAAVASAQSSGELSKGGTTKTLYLGQRGNATVPWTGYVHAFIALEGAAEKKLFEIRGSDITEPAASFTDRVADATVTINRTGTGLLSALVDRDWFTFTTNDYMQIAHDAGLDWAEADDFTIVATVRTNVNSAGGDYLYAKRNANGVVLQAIAVGGNIGPRIFLDGASTGTNTDGPEATDYVTGVWAGRRDADGSPYAFLDGTPGSAGTDSTGTLEDGADIYVGSNSGASAFWEGEIASLAVFPEALTDEEIYLTGLMLLSGTVEDPLELHGDALHRWIVANDTNWTSSSSLELVGLLNELNGTNGVEYAQARGTYLGVPPAG